MGVTQIDAGTRIGVGGYRQSAGNMLPDKEQFQLGDTRSLDQVIYETCKMGNFPSFCTACYRAGPHRGRFYGGCQVQFCA